MDSPQLQAGLDYAGAGWCSLPLYGITAGGLCACGKPPGKCKPGKHPLTKNGNKDASATTRALWDWFNKWPDANIGIALEPSGLVDIAPDSPEWLERFRGRGLPRTATFRSGGGEGHVHYLYQRPEGCPAHRICETGQYDIISAGYCVAPPSRHESGNQYQWLIPPGEFPQGLPIAPDWAVAMLRQAVEKAPKEKPDSSGSDDPPVRLSTAGLAYWHGERVKQKPDGSTDRSTTMYGIAGFLAESGASERTIVDALENRDVALGFGKYTDRRDRTEYKRIAAKVLQPPGDVTSSADFPPGTSPPLYRKPLAEVRLVRTNAGTLQRRAKNGEIPELTRLPLLGEVDSSPIIKGWSHMFVAYPKMGKTELLARLAAEWSNTGLKVVYLTEEPESVWTARLSKLPVGFENVDLVHAMGAKADELLYVINDGADDVVVLDTIRLLRLSDERDNSEINIALTPFITLCRQKASTLCLSHHTRKAGGEHGEAAAGGHAFFGIVDVSLELNRDKQAARRRIIKGWGRVLEIPDLVYELQDDGSMNLLGDRSLLDFIELKDRVREMLTYDEQTTKQIEDAIGEPKPSRDSTARVLEALAKEGVADRNPPISEGSRPGKTYTWRNLTSANPSLKSGGEVEVLLDTDVEVF